MIKPINQVGFEQVEFEQVEFEQVEFLHRRLARAKELVKSKQIVAAQGTTGPLYVCHSPRTGEIYIVSETCPCQDRFRFFGKKLCKHMLAKMILLGQINASKINKNPFYFSRGNANA